MVAMRDDDTGDDEALALVLVLVLTRALTVMVVLVLVLGKRRRRRVCSVYLGPGHVPIRMMCSVAHWAGRMGTRARLTCRPMASHRLSITKQPNPLQRAPSPPHTRHAPANPPRPLHDSSPTCTTRPSHSTQLHHARILQKRPPLTSPSLASSLLRLCPPRIHTHTHPQHTHRALPWGY